MLKEFTTLPNDSHQNKVDYYFLPYSPRQETSKYLQYEQKSLENNIYKFVKYEDPRVK